MKHNKLTGKIAEDNPWVNSLDTPKRRPTSQPKGENREARRAKDRDVRLELKRITKQLPLLEEGTKEWYVMDMRKSELELYQASPHMSVNTPHTK